MEKINIENKHRKDKSQIKTIESLNIEQKKHRKKSL